MKLALPVFTLALAAIAAATAVPDCNSCTSLLEFCFKNGHTPGQTGCLQTCREHVCHRTPAVSF
ncbi:hypothetical protein P153DRAFT_387341 [Dothidotthia symphoricarpi CBS 119687]|uniref:Extracellular membrane protein CFEM domain-containing protein n=1 Tax=Dothidotthia symphoricarpi CBS 119687 TaxID=1392245 RepID=A0A6A6A6T1_9PLEO|nr:uncharacterized protein P153DRAFT_387341 [Dothidotthia symphoricarpi CBS 119687]KAF2127599.1 hypothetical protein P153DRAFT_387341 [Dothidotthia symphoricarpi CBS 119687]